MPSSVQHFTFGRRLQVSLKNDCDLKTNAPKLSGIVTRLLTFAAAVSLGVLCPGFAVAQAPAPAPAIESLTTSVPSTWFIYSVISVVFVVALIALGYVRSAVSESSFSLADALSEETLLTVTEKDAQGNDIPKLGPDGKPLMMTVLAGSVSRVIALTGSITLVIMFIGFGAFVMFSFGSGAGAPKDLDKVINFLIAGLILFAPYLVNKFSALFDGITSKPPAR